MIMTLIEAIKKNSEKEFFEILKLKTDPSGKRFIDEVDPAEGGGPLYWAAAFGRIHFIEPLIKAGATVNKADNYGWTPVYAAAHHGYAEIITALKEVGGADVDRPNDSGTTPVCAATYRGHVEAIIALKVAGANVNTTEINGLTPIYIAVQMRDVKAINTLLEVGANANTGTPHGTPLELAKQGKTERDQAIVSLLEAHLKQYPNGIKARVNINQVAALPAKSNLQMEKKELSDTTKMHQNAEDLPESSGHDKVHIEAAGEKVTTVTGGIRADDDVIIGSGNSSGSAEVAPRSPDGNLRKAVEVNNIAVLEKLEQFFMSEEYDGPQSQDCELYNSALRSHNAQLIYGQKTGIHKLYINKKPLEAQGSIEAIAAMIASLQALNTQTTVRSSNVYNSAASSGSTYIQAQGKIVTTITGGVVTKGKVVIGRSSAPHDFPAYQQFKNRNIGTYSGNLVNQTGNTGLAAGISKAIKSINRVTF